MEILVKPSGDKQFVILQRASQPSAEYAAWRTLNAQDPRLHRELAAALQNDHDTLAKIARYDGFQSGQQHNPEHMATKLLSNDKLVVRYQASEPRTLPDKHADANTAAPETAVNANDPVPAPKPNTPAPPPSGAQGGTVSGQPCPEQTRCTESGCPINMTLGQEQLPVEDFALPGPVPFVWKRFYRSGHSRDIGLGHGWTHTGCEVLVLEEDRVRLWADDGREIRFTRPYIGQSSRQLAENLELQFVAAQQFILKQPGQPSKVFEREGGNRYRLTQIRHKAYRAPEKGATGEGDGEQGYALTLHYNVQNKLVRITGNWGRGLLFTRNEQGRVTQVHPLTPDGEKREPALAQYDYDAAGDLIAHRNADGHGEHYQYRNHIITQRTLATGFHFYFEWDQHSNNGRCLRNWGDRGIYDYTFAWDPAHNASQTTDSRGFTTAYHYNAFGLVTEAIDHEGHRHRKVFNTAGQLVEAMDPLGHKTQYHYDKEQRLLGVTNALGYQSGGSYFQGEMTAFTDAAGHRWQRQFHPNGLLAEVTGPRGETTRYQYTQNGLLSKLTDPAQRVTTYTWNVNAELVKQTDPLGNSLHYRYDDGGRVIAVTAQEKGQALEEAVATATTRYAYTAAGLIQKTIRPNGEASELRYNEAGQLTTFIDPQGRITQYQYDDGLRQPSLRIDAAGQRIRYEYDTERNLTALINENGDRHSFEYDGNERLIKETGFDGRVQQYHYNAAGHLVKHLDAGAVHTEFERDALGQLQAKSSQSLQLGGQQLGKQKLREHSQYRYDALGRLIETCNAHQYLAFAYDPLGNILQESQIDLNGALDGGGNKQLAARQRQDIRHQYNILGQRVSTALPDGQTLRYGYHDSLAFKTIKLNNTIVTDVERDHRGRERIRHQGDLQTRTDYDPQGRLLKQQAVNTHNKQTPIQRDYGYDAFGNINWIKDGPEETRYIYDTLDRLKRTDGAHPEFFSFDPAGNLLAISDSKSPSPGLAKGNRLLIQGDKKFDYDARGNLITESRGKDGKRQKHFQYNLQNQLIRVDTNTQHETVSFTYDPLGRRIEKRDAFGVTRFLWVDNLLTQETRNTIKKTYVYEPGSFRPVALVQDDQVYHYHLDHLGTPRELTDHSGNIVWKARYKTYGNLALKEIDEVENNLRFQGQYYDTETGLHYNRFRYYHPESGQFINQDPIGLLGGLNNYQYAPNPTMWVDPLGLVCKENAWNKFQAHHKGQFNNSSDAASAYNDLKKSQSPWPINFDPPEATLIPGTQIKMALSPGQSSTRPGAFATFDDIPDVNYARNKLAIKEAWKPSIDRVATYEVIKPLPVKIGPVGPQIETGKYFAGGGSQVEMAVKATDRMSHLKLIDETPII